MKTTSRSATDRWILDAIMSYANLLKKFGDHRRYETTLLLLMKNDFRKTYTDICISDLPLLRLLNNKKGTGFALKIHQSRAYSKLVNEICSSTYFKKFSPYEVLIRREILSDFLTQFTSFATLFYFYKQHGLEINETEEEFEKFVPKTSKYPLIEHRRVKKNKGYSYQLSFNEDTPLKLLTAYLKNVIGIGKGQKLKKFKLGMVHGLELLWIEQYVKNSNFRKKGEYLESAIMRYIQENGGRKRGGIYAIKKTIQRMKKIKNDINTKDISSK